LSGADTWTAVALWGRAKLGWLRRFLPFESKRSAAPPALTSVGFAGMV